MFFLFHLNPGRASFSGSPLLSQCQSVRQPLTASCVKLPHLSTITAVKLSYPFEAETVGGHTRQRYEATNHFRVACVSGTFSFVSPANLGLTWIKRYFC